MAEAIALVLLYVFAAKNWLDPSGVERARTAFAALDEWLVDRGLTTQMSRWLVGALVPAVILMAIDASFEHWVLQIIITLVVLFFLLPMREYYERSREVCAGIYANDRARAIAAANAWEPTATAVEDGAERMPKRLLGLCAQRLHFDLLAVLFWHALLGSGGAVLYFASRSIIAEDSRIAFVKSTLEYLPALVSITLFGLVGNFVPALREVLSGDVERGALAASELDGDAIELERVPPYRLFLQRVLLFGFIFAAIFEAFWR